MSAIEEGDIDQGADRGTGGRSDVIARGRVTGGEMGIEKGIGEGIGRGVANTSGGKIAMSGERSDMTMMSVHDLGRDTGVAEVGLHMTGMTGGEIEMKVKVLTPHIMNTPSRCDHWNLRRLTTWEGSGKKQ